MAKRTLAGGVEELVVQRDVTVHGVVIPAETTLSIDDARLEGVRLDPYIANGTFKVVGQLPLRSNHDKRAAHVYPHDYRKAAQG